MLKFGTHVLMPVWQAFYWMSHLLGVCCYFWDRVSCRLALNTQLSCLQLSNTKVTGERQYAQHYLLTLYLCIRHLAVCKRTQGWQGFVPQGVHGPAGEHRSRLESCGVMKACPCRGESWRGISSVLRLLTWDRKLTMPNSLELLYRLEETGSLCSLH